MGDIAAYPRSRSYVFFSKQSARRHLGGAIYDLLVRDGYSQLPPQRRPRAPAQRGVRPRLTASTTRKKRWKYAGMGRRAEEHNKAQRVRQAVAWPLHGETPTPDARYRPPARRGHAVATWGAGRLVLRRPPARPARCRAGAVAPAPHRPRRCCVPCTPLSGSARSSAPLLVSPSPPAAADHLTPPSPPTPIIPRPPHPLHPLLDRLSLPPLHAPHPKPPHPSTSPVNGCPHPTHPVCPLLALRRPARPERRRCEAGAMATDGDSAGPPPGTPPASPGKGAPPPRCRRPPPPPPAPPPPHPPPPPPPPPRAPSASRTYPPRTQSAPAGAPTGRAAAAPPPTGRPPSRTAGGPSPRALPPAATPSRRQRTWCRC